MSDGETFRGSQARAAVKTIQRPGSLSDTSLSVFMTTLVINRSVSRFIKVCREYTRCFVSICFYPNEALELLTETG